MPAGVVFATNNHQIGPIPGNKVKCSVCLQEWEGSVPVASLGACSGSTSGSGNEEENDEPEKFIVCVTAPTSTRVNYDNNLVGAPNAYKDSDTTDSYKIEIFGMSDFSICNLFVRGPEKGAIAKTFQLRYKTEHRSDHLSNANASFTLDDVDVNVTMDSEKEEIVYTNDQGDSSMQCPHGPGLFPHLELRQSHEDAKFLGVYTFTPDALDIGQLVVGPEYLNYTTPTNWAASSKKAECSLQLGFLVMTYEDYKTWCEAQSPKITPQPKPN